MMFDQAEREIPPIKQLAERNGCLFRENYP